MYRRVIIRKLCKLFRNYFALKNNPSKCEFGERFVFSYAYKRNERRKKPLFCEQNCIYFGLGFLCLYLTIGIDNFRRNAILPSVHASDRDYGKNITGSHRRNFNFIATVVEKTASSVVFIGIVDLYRKDIFTGLPLLKSNGSGFIVSSDGLILTNAHVVHKKESSSVIVKMTDGTLHPASIEFIDVRHDLATVRIKPTIKRLSTIKLGSTRDLRPGEWVIAIGSPLAFSNTATCGVVSTVQRTSHELGMKDPVMYYIQTDAPITFGNSGGPLVNLDGEVIGINALKVTNGISFAIPIEFAKEFLRLTARAAPSQFPDIWAEPKRYVGMTVLSLNIDIIRELQFDDKRIPNDVSFGVLIWKVMEDSPAHLGGLKPGDILTHINGVAIKNADVMYDLIEQTCCALNMIVVRGYKRLTLLVVPDENK